MIFDYAPHWRAPAPDAEGMTFTIGALWSRKAGTRTEISHLFDRSYRYQSPRELQWYLAEKFGLPVSSVAVCDV